MKQRCDKRANFFWKLDSMVYRFKTDFADVIQHGYKLLIHRSRKNQFYFVLESSRIVIALISKTYLESKVCQEEFNLAQSHSMDHTLPHSLKLFRVLLEDFQELPVWCGNKKNMFDFTSKDFADFRKFCMYMDHDFDNCKQPFFLQMLIFMN